jgi:hypothetical protein
MFSEAICTYAMSVPPGESSESSSDPIAPPVGSRTTGMGLAPARERINLKAALDAIARQSNDDDAASPRRGRRPAGAGVGQITICRLSLL